MNIKAGEVNRRGGESVAPLLYGASGAAEERLPHSGKGGALCGMSRGA